MWEKILQFFSRLSRYFVFDKIKLTVSEFYQFILAMWPLRLLFMVYFKFTNILRWPSTMNRKKCFEWNLKFCFVKVKNTIYLIGFGLNQVHSVHPKNILIIRNKNIYFLVAWVTDLLINTYLSNSPDRCIDLYLWLRTETLTFVK